ncbi:baculoviral IAP repeat-containing protein 5 [Protopterus annectens]|uniref:baculoviral IAP repeat-containing protein 5 n=1 Tax=Protopterus annectens TaxID=7888 RepID=UPI001CFACC96|nr:baculoviral IAP repeat-containing protein 5 [Protopterus annectens]
MALEKHTGLEVLPDEWRLYVLENRLRTYVNWPFTDDCNCTPYNMASAGWLHCPSENGPDVAQCFFCFKELENWEPEDSPLEEHAKHSPACGFVQLKKKVEELTVQEFLKLDKERVKNRTNKQYALKTAVFNQMAEKVRQSIENLGS